MDTLISGFPASGTPIGNPETGKLSAAFPGRKVAGKNPESETNPGTTLRSPVGLYPVGAMDNLLEQKYGAPWRQTPDPV
jgi:hypothetical protein